MINILAYVGMTLQSEVCLWTLLGLLRTIFDATLFKVNANLKQVWQMTMPAKLSMPVQRVLRTMISGVMLVQCFTVYVYLASYIVLLYPVFLEERPTLVLPWLLLAAVRKLLCELTSLALGLGTCVLLGPARPPCIMFVVTKLTTIMPAFYMWMLVLSYYHTLKMASAFKIFPAVLPANDHDYGLELAVRRRKTKSLQDEDQLRRRLISSLYSQRHTSADIMSSSRLQNQQISHKALSKDASIEDIHAVIDGSQPLSVTSNRTISDIGTYEDWFGSEVAVPRDTDRILEQFGLMLMRIGVYLKKEGVDSMRHFKTSSQIKLEKNKPLSCTTLPNEDTDTPPLVGNSKGRIASYLRDYPQIFMKKPSEIMQNLKTEYKDILKARYSDKESTEIHNASTQKDEYDTENKMSSNTSLFNQQEILKMLKVDTSSTRKNKKNNKNMSHNLKIDSSGSICSIVNRSNTGLNCNNNQNKDKSQCKNIEEKALTSNHKDEPISNNKEIEEQGCEICSRRSIHDNHSIEKKDNK